MAQRMLLSTLGYTQRAVLLHDPLSVHSRPRTFENLAERFPLDVPLERKVFQLKMNSRALEDKKKKTKKKKKKKKKKKNPTDLRCLVVARLPSS